jgi:hypothetical protein
VAVSLHVVSKVVTRRNRDGSLKQYRYYQLVRSSRKGGKVQTKFLAYLGKAPLISREKAAEIGISLADLQRVKGLQIAAEEEGMMSRNGKAAPSQVERQLSREEEEQLLKRVWEMLTARSSPGPVAWELAITLGSGKRVRAELTERDARRLGRWLGLELSGSGTSKGPFTFARLRREGGGDASATADG